MKKLLAVLIVLVMVFSLAACGTTETGNQGETQVLGYDDIADEMTSEDGIYPIAFVTDVGQLKDHSFNEGIYNGVKKFGYDNNIAYKYYQPANGDQATDEDRIAAMTAAVDGGAKIVVCAGFMAGAAIEASATKYPDVKWVYVDGNAFEGLNNTVGVNFKEEECGFFAGYACVKEGFTKLGFAGGGGGTTPACCRYGYGFIQGANAAAAELGVQVEMNYSWLYGASFGPSPELETMLNSWYANGTEVVFPCGGAMYLSAFAAASANDAWALGVDSDQAGDSDTVLTSALKGVDQASYQVLGTFFAEQWDTIGGTTINLGTKDNAIGLPTAESSWRFQKFTVAEYEKLVEDLKAGTLVIDGTTLLNLDACYVDYSNVTVTPIQ